MEDHSSSFLTTPMAILLSSFVVATAILVHGGIIKVGNSGATVPTTATAPQAPSQPQAAPAQPTKGKASVDDDPVLGNKDAKVTLIEFSDYECPFCKRHFDQTYPQLKKDYIDTGKVKLVFRDFPLSFHDPMATTEAIAANCAKDQGGDTAYFKIHDAMFTKTTSNGSGLSKDQIWTMAQELGLNVTNFKSCVESDKHKSEVAKDIADGSAAGVSGTPSFIVGKSDPSGNIEGSILIGAQPYSAFQAAIDPLLK